MGAVGLFFVGAVLIVNGLMLLGHVSPLGAAPLNLFVGTLQAVIPTYLIWTAGGDAAAIFSAGALYLFGFTYLWVGINNAAGWPGEGLGWFSLFVAVAAIVHSIYQFIVVGDPGFGVIWLMWAGLWFLFFLVLALGRAELTAATGIVAVIEGIATCMVPALMLLLKGWRGSLAEGVVLALVAVATAAMAMPLGARLRARSAVPHAA